MELTIELVVSFALNAVAIAYGYGILQQRVKHNNEDIKDIHQRESEIFTRIRNMEMITPALKDSVERMEKITSNGLVKEVRDIERRITKLEHNFETKSE